MDSKILKQKNVVFFNCEIILEKHTTEHSSIWYSLTLKYRPYEKTLVVYYNFDQKTDALKFYNFLNYRTVVTFLKEVK